MVSLLKNNAADFETNRPLLQLENISKSFFTNEVLSNVNFSLNQGEVHALLGENGAGKSTLMKIISGILKATKGTISFNGEKITFNNPRDAQQQGIALIHQEISLVPGLSVAENIYLGQLPYKKTKKINWSELYIKARKVLDTLNCTFSEKELVGNLTIAHQQMVEIARAIANNPKVIIFDEPTASLSEKEKIVLFENINQLKSNGVGIIYISHRMDEIFEISDRITILRDGKKTGEFVTKDTDVDEVTFKMIGRNIEVVTNEQSRKLDKEYIRVEGLSKANQFNDINFSVHAGEIVGLYGLIGAGRTEVAETIFGIQTPDKGRIIIDNKETKIKSPTEAIQLGIGLVPEDRKSQGLFLEMSCVENLSITNVDRLQKFGWINKKSEINLFKKYQQKMNIKTSNPNNLVKSLSGGNQQKIALSKWLATQPKFLILDEPTRGVDIGAKTEIYKIIQNLADEGIAILVISSEMPEVLALSDRILTMYQGKISADLKNEGLTELDLIKAATNQK